MKDETCAVCGEELTNDFYDDICDVCAQDDGLDGPWDDEEDNGKD